MKLSRRLETIVSMVPQCTAAADVGTDHGFVPIRLIELKKADRVIAMDVRSGPLMRAREHILQRGMEDRIETRLSDGLEKLLPGEAETVIIAGMGGELMLRILQAGDHVRGHVRRFILSPQSELSFFRHGLEALGLAIVEETMVEEDGKYYTVMVAEQGTMHYGEEYRYRYGDCLIRHNSPELKGFLKREAVQCREILKQLAAQDGEGAKTRSQELEETLHEIEEACHAMQGIDETA